MPRGPLSNFFEVGFRAFFLGSAFCIPSLLGIMIYTLPEGCPECVPPILIHMFVASSCICILGLAILGLGVVLTALIRTGYLKEGMWLYNIWAYVLISSLILLTCSLGMLELGVSLGKAVGEAGMAALCVAVIMFGCKPKPSPPESLEDFRERLIRF